jgi:hypothetical protein
MKRYELKHDKINLKIRKISLSDHKLISLLSSFIINFLNFTVFLFFF